MAFRLARALTLGLHLFQAAFAQTSDTWDFNGTSTFADYGWIATGDLIGQGPAQGTLAGQQAVTGNRGNFVNTFLNGDATTGTLTSPNFTITQNTINFLIGGGNAPGTECINLNVQGQVVRTATGADAEQLIPATWDVTDLIGQSAVIEIVDLSTTGWGHILIDEISFSNTSTAPSDFRPVFHFCPAENWMNEPNGLIKIDSNWHLFHQHNPNGNFWGNMSWGHAISTDLLHWTHEPIAISSADGIQAFTGTSYYDVSNTSGLGTSGSPPYLAFFTGYFPSNGVQDQRLAYSLDNGMTYTKFQGNPIISQQQESPHDISGGLESRDPKAFFHQPTGQWVMVLAHGGQDKMTFWTSPDTITWTWQSDFTSGSIPNLPGGITGWEVPDFFELPIQGTSSTTWVLMFTPANGSPAGGNGVVALTGSFDGKVFTANPVDPNNLWLDYGRDWDGAMGWENVPTSDGRRILAAVMNSYGTNPPTNTWKGMLSFPRTLELQQFNGALRFLQQPVAELNTISGLLQEITNQTISPGQTLLSTTNGAALDINMSFIPSAGSTLSLAVRKGGSEQTVINYTQSSAQMSVDRSSSGNISYDPNAGGVHVANLQPDTTGAVQLRVLVDTCSLEVYGGLGEAVISDLIFPSSTSDGLSLTASGGDIFLQSVQVRGVTP